MTQGENVNPYPRKQKREERKFPIKEWEKKKKEERKFQIKEWEKVKKEEENKKERNFLIKRVGENKKRMKKDEVWAFWGVIWTRNE